MIINDVQKISSPKIANTNKGLMVIGKNSKGVEITLLCTNLYSWLCAALVLYFARSLVSPSGFGWSLNQ